MKKFLSLILVSMISATAFAIQAMDGNWETDYIVGHGKTMVNIDGLNVKITADRNTCTLDAIGMPKACTRMMPFDFIGTLKSNIEESGKFARGTMIYNIEGTRFGIVYFHNPNATWMRLLEYNCNGEVIFSTMLNSK